MASDRDAGAPPVDAIKILTEVTGIVAEPGTPADRAEALLAQLRRVVPFDAGWIALLSPSQEAHVPLARTGYDERVSARLDSAPVLEEVEQVGLNRSRRPIRGRDMPFPPSEVPTWAEYLQPAGFRDGVGAGLFTPAGRYLGVLALHTGAADQVSDAARDLLGVLAPHVAAAVDPLRSLAALARLVQGASAGVVLGADGRIEALPGLADHVLLAADSPALAAARAVLRAGQVHRSFLWPLGDRHAPGAHVRLTVLTTGEDLPSRVAGLVLVSPPGDLRGLTPRELEVLGLLVEGCSNAEIARVLVVARRTVAAHVEHVLVKLSASSRTLAAVRAERAGLYVPHLAAGSPR